MKKNGYVRPSENKAIWKESYDAMIFDHDVTKKNLSHDWNYNAGAVMWPKFGNFRISMREVIITSIL